MEVQEGKETGIEFQVIGCAMRVLNAIGHGLREKTYERGMIVELSLEGFEVADQVHFDVEYRGHTIDTYVPDLMLKGALIIEVKTVEAIIDEHLGQVINYLKITGIQKGLILNFKHPRLGWRVVTLKAKD